MSKVSRRRKKRSTGLLNWFRSQGNITKVIYWVVAFIFVVGAFASFGGLGGSGSSCSSATHKLTPEQKVKMAEAVATVGDKEILRQDYEEEWATASSRRDDIDKNIYVPPPEDYYVHRWEVLNSLMMRDMVEQESALKGLAIEQTEVDKVLEQQKEYLGLNAAPEEKPSPIERLGGLLNKAKGQKNFEARLWEKAKMTPKQLEKAIRESLLQQKFFDKFQEDIQGELDTEGKTKADEIFAKINSGTDFDAVVAEYKADTTHKVTSEDASDVKRDSGKPQEIMDNAFGLAVGEVSAPFHIKESMQNPFQQGAEPMVFEFYAIVKLLNKKSASGPDFDAQVETIREKLRKDKFDKEKKDNKDIKLEDIDVSDDEIAAGFEEVSYKLLKVESSNVSLQNERAEAKIKDMRERYKMVMLEPSLATWEKLADKDYQGARDEWALFIADEGTSLDDPKLAKMDELERESAEADIQDRLATFDYIDGLLFRIQIEGYRSPLYNLTVSGEKQDRAKERWDAYNAKPEAEKVEGEQQKLQDPTDEEKAEYRTLNEQALPFFDKALEVIQEDAYMFLHTAETNADLENWEKALDLYETTYEFASDDGMLNSRIQSDLSKLLGMFDDNEKAGRLQKLMDEVTKKVDELRAKMEEAQKQQQQQQQGGPQGPPQGPPQ